MIRTLNKMTIFSVMKTKTCVILRRKTLWIADMKRKVSGAYKDLFTPVKGERKTR